MAVCEISVLIPVNSDRFLAETLRSIQAQTIDHDLIEIVLILDRIKETTIRNIINSEIKDILVSINESKVPGIVSALNLGLKLSTGKFIARLDHDDIMYPNRLKFQHEFLICNPDFSAIGGRITLIDETGKFLGDVHYPVKSGTCKNLIFFFSPIPHPASMFRKEIVLEIGGYREKLPEDWDLWARLSEKSRIGNLNIPVINYRVHAEQLSRMSMYQINNARKLIITSRRLRRRGLYDLPEDNFTPEKWYTQNVKSLNYGSIFLKTDKMKWQIWDVLQFIHRAIRKIAQIIGF
ncbi:WcaA Glycosyltransferases involved in cell wall biogenesis [actinobacterium SCGC AAA044-D11]